MYTGNERLILNGKELPYSLLNFWQIHLSAIQLNMTRGSFAEFLVQCAMMEHGYDSMHQEKDGTEAWDIDGPSVYAPAVPQDYSTVSVRRSRIEVKCTASIQRWTDDSLEPYRLKDTALTFSIREAVDSYHPELGSHRNSDLYVFAHYKAEYKSCNLLDLRFWDFYLYPTFRIDDNPSLSKQKTISIYRLKELGVQPKSFEEVFPEMMRIIDEVSAHTRARESEA